jgi:uroporphyrinogen decarboxylase
MNDRARFLAHMNYQPVDRCPMWDFGFSDEVLARWRTEGLPPDADLEQLFGMDQQWRDCSVSIGLKPDFKWEVLEDFPDRRIVRRGDGVVQLELKYQQSMPKFLTYSLTDRASWDELRRRLDPTTPDRIPSDWAQRCKRHVDRDYPLLIWAGSIYGWARDWAGMETLSKLLYRDRTLYPEIAETLATLTCTVLRRALEEARQVGLTFDAANMWEDMCFRNGPLLSPKMFREYMVPHYKRITGLLREYGVKLVILDCDGCIDALAEMWLEAGVNVMFPLEIGTWQADPYAFRQRYGKDMRLMGGFDKRILAAGPAKIDAEVDRLGPLVAEGGFIPFCDHRVPPDVPLAHYLHYLRRAREVWGKGVNLRPMWEGPAR